MQALFFPLRTTKEELAMIKKMNQEVLMRAAQAAQAMPQNNQAADGTTPMRVDGADGARVSGNDKVEAHVEALHDHPRWTGVDEEPGSVAAAEGDWCALADIWGSEETEGSRRCGHSGELNGC